MYAVESSYAPVLAFWFGPLPDEAALPTAMARRWFEKSAVFDEEIRARFNSEIQQASRGELASWSAEPRGTLALLILIDQMRRNIYRDQAAAFAADSRALSYCLDGLATGQDQALYPVERIFFYLPLEHAESLALQERSVDLFTRLARNLPPGAPTVLRDFFDATLDFAVRHRDIVARFGRFPHRNAVLRRPTTEEEAVFLQGPGSGF